LLIAEAVNILPNRPRHELNEGVLWFEFCLSKFV